MASFSIPLTGLNADSTALNTIANDLSNMNTTAFKSQSTNFADLFYQEIGSTGSGDPIQVGAGTQVASNETDFSQGSINSTSNPTDVALNGNGFFVVDDGNGGTEFTRAGNFSLTSAGDLVTSGGFSVMGYPALNGVVNTNAPLVPLNIPIGVVQQPQATTSLSMTANLDSSSTPGTQFPAQVTVYDSLGSPHLVTVTYTETATNTWDYSAGLPAADFASGVSTPVTGTLTFDGNGNLISVAQTAPVAVASTPVGTAAGDLSSIPLSFTGLADGAADLNMNWNLLGSNGTPTISQLYATSAVPSTNQDGYEPGQYRTFTIGSDGTVTAVYSNGQKEAVGQLALANVNNVQGLQMMGDGNYATTRASGTASISTSGTSGLGTLQDGALEASNVNISAEFSDLIIAQRAFEANSKTVTTFDTVTQETINMIH
ncbi:MAG TPA: flagellar hook protein FlgE [Terracidiphilus sp.]|nr:flagellar hook protein FlgE [Terracidiphilus sp.]